jgi:microbial collagenase
LGSYALSTIYGNVYGDGQTRIYNWGYLASRFMFEKRRSQVTSILGFFRPGNYTGYASYMSSLGTGNDAAFAAWLPCVVNASAPGCTGAVNVAPVAGFNVALSGLTASFSDASTDADGTIPTRLWNFGDGSTATATNPSKTYAVAGTYVVSLKVTDNLGASNTVSKNVTVTANGSVTVLSNGVAKTGLTAATGVDVIYAIDVPIGATNLSIATSGGTGDVDMYVRFGSAASLSSYDCGPYLAGNNESCTFATPQAGRYFVLLHAYSAYANVSLLASYVGTNTLPECTDTNLLALGKNCSRSNRSVTLGNYDYMYILIPAGTAQLKITTSGGSGNADLYFNPSTWATTTAFTQSSKSAGNSELIIVTNPPAGYLYISLHGVSAASGVKVSTQY